MLNLFNPLFQHPVHNNNLLTWLMRVHFPPLTDIGASLLSAHYGWIWTLICNMMLQSSDGASPITSRHIINNSFPSAASVWHETSQWRPITFHTFHFQLINYIPQRVIRIRARMHMFTASWTDGICRASQDTLVAKSVATLFVRASLSTSKQMAQIKLLSGLERKIFSGWPMAVIRIYFDTQSNNL